MTPSDSSESHKGEPAAYQNMKQALFKVDNGGSSSSGNGDRIESANALGGHNPKFPSNSNDNPEHSNANADEMDTRTGKTVTSTSNLPLIATKHQQSNSNHIGEQYSVKSITNASSKPEQSGIVTSTVVVTLEGAKPIKPRPVSTGIEGTGASEANINPIAAASASAATAATLANDSPSTKAPERTTSTTKSKGTARRRGKWTLEEEEYVARVIQDFNSGFLNAPAGYTLRSYLSDKLQCDPMRITKKFTGESCIGKRVFHPAVRSAANATAIDKAQAELDALERRWRRRLEMQQRESAKKAAASAAAANAAIRGTVTVQGVPVSMLGASSQSASDSQLQQSAVTQAATWLDRANVILMGNIGNENQADSSLRSKGSNESLQQNKDGTTSTHSSAEDSLEHQMKEVQRLIYEGPIIQQTTAGLPNLLLRTSASIATDHQTTQISDTNTIIAASATSTTVGRSSMPSSSAHVTPTLEPADKRMRTTNATDSGAEDAEALVGFLRSVRASAAAGQEL